MPYMKINCCVKYELREVCLLIVPKLHHFRRKVTDYNNVPLHMIEAMVCHAELRGLKVVSFSVYIEGCCWPENAM